MKRILHILFFIFFLSSGSYAQNRVRIDLGGNLWKLRDTSGTGYYTATVPGCVHTDLIDNGIIEDPYYRDNETRVQWVGDRDWEYSAVFTAGKNILEHTNLELVFEGLDTYANVYLNGEMIICADNFFREWRADVKKLLKNGDNRITVIFRSSTAINRQTRKEAEIPLLEDYVYTRKPAYHYGWDWGPVLTTQGIWKPVYLEAWNDARIKNFYIKQRNVSTENARLEAITEIECTDGGNYTVTLEENNRAATCKKISLEKGRNTVIIPFNIENPRLWWTHQLGEPYLYRFMLELTKVNSVIDTAEIKTGLRTIELVQEPDSLGKTFYFKLNGIPVFIKGANYIPQDMFPSRVTEADYEKLIRQARDANMNMLRVWGGGLYENDIFYDLCDENGILVWQDFMFACALYPGNPEFTANVEAEICDNVERLRNHPSIAIWCGNNESYVGWLDWGWQKKFTEEQRKKVWNDYERLFDTLIPNTLDKLAPGSIYWPSSPKKNWGRPSNTDGDSHYWGVWHGQYPFEVLSHPDNIPRFMSEFGFQSCPTLNSVERFTSKEDRDINSPVMRLHQKHRIGYPVIDKYMEWYYRKPVNFQSYLYVSQLLQAKGVRYGIEVHRRNRPHCMGTLYWQLNDCYPVASWSGIDYYGTRKALHYTVKEAYADILVSPFEENGKTDIYIISDKLSRQNAVLNVTLMDFSGKRLFNKKIKVSVQPNTSIIYFSLATDQLIAGRDKKSILLLCELKDGKKTISQNIHYFVAPKNLKLEKTNINKTVVRNGNGYEIILSSKKLAKNVYVYVEDEEATFSDNFFDLLPGKPKKIVANNKNITKGTVPRIKTYSLIDTYH